MIEHKQLWDAIDALARVKGYSTSGLAKKAGLDSTIFNKSKRVTSDGKLRWPTTQSIAKILETTECSMGKFATLMQNTQAQKSSIFLPLHTLSTIQKKCSFINKKGQPIDGQKENIRKNTHIDNTVFMIKVDSNIYVPVYNKGDLLMVSTQNTVRKKDRALIATRSGETILAVVKSLTSHAMKISPIGNTVLAKDELPMQEICWIARILWKSEF